VAMKRMLVMITTSLLILSIAGLLVSEPRIMLHVVAGTVEWAPLVTAGTVTLTETHPVETKETETKLKKTT
jgi:hypothetical protein